METYKFEQITSKIKIFSYCSICNKKYQKTIKETQTLNPFNKRNNGKIKSRLDIQRENEFRLKKSLREAKKNKFCKKCLQEMF